MKRFVLLAAAFALSGCARGLLADAPVDPQQMAANEAAEDAALDAVISCTEPKVASYAGAQDAAPDVAAAIVGACHSEVGAYEGRALMSCYARLKGNPYAASACQTRSAATSAQTCNKASPTASYGSARSRLSASSPPPTEVK